MPAPSRAHLLLPSPQGLVHYDLLEDTVYLGPGPRGGLFASPAPFREAKVVLREEGGAFLVRPMPGESAPEVDGASGDGTRLADGARLRLGDHVALFRTDAVAALPPAPVAAIPAAVPSAATVDMARPRRAPARIGVPAGAKNAARVLMMTGLAAFLLAAYLAVHELDTSGTQPASPVVPETPKGPESGLPHAEEIAQRAYADAEALEQAHRDDVEGVVATYTRVVRAYPQSAAALRAAARVSALWPRLAQHSLDQLTPEVTSETNGGRYRRAIAALDDFEGRFAGTDAAAAARTTREKVREQARSALDSLRKRAAPLIAADPTKAYRVLTSSGLELPPDLEAELAALIAQARDLWGAKVAAGVGEKPTPTPGGRTKPPTKNPPGGDATPAPGGERETAAKAAWAAAHEALVAGRYQDAKKGYATLLHDFKDTATVSGGAERLKAGRQAADAGLRGAAAFVSEEATWKDGKLTVEFPFEDEKAFRADFDVLQPFPDEEPVSAEVVDGRAVLRHSTLLLMKVVFDPDDVAWEADCVADEPRDIGLFGLQEGSQYRACAMEVGNTQFKLKKGPAATVLAGHVLWLYGQGVWKDADPGANGFVRLAVKNVNLLKSAERFRVRAEIHAGQMTGTIKAKGEDVELKAALKGDDGKGIGPLRVGPFTFKGAVGIERFWVSGKVDAEWLKKQIDALVAQEAGPS